MANSKRKCRHCGEFGEAESGVKVPLGWFCSHSHAVEFAMEKSAKQRERQAAKARKERETKEKEARKENRQRRMELKPESYWMRRAQDTFNSYIRARDSGLPCVSCGAPAHAVEAAQGWKVGGAWDCGHYLSVGSHQELRFEPLNAHRQCKSCNGGAGNYTRKNWQTASDYRDELIRRIGLDKVEWLEGPHEPKRYRKDDYQQIEALYKQKLKELKDKGQ
jgi:hypothetical protein